MLRWLLRRTIFNFPAPFREILRDKTFVKADLIKFLQMLGDPAASELPGEIDELLNNCQARIQTMYADVQILKDESHKDADSIYKT